MIANQNLPFHQDYFSNSQNLEHLRTSINTLISNDIYTLESLLSVVENTLSHGHVLPTDQLHSQTLKKQKELELFKYLSEQNRDRSDTVTGLAQLVIKMIDYIEEQHQKHQILVRGYLRKIDQLNDTISQVSYSKSMAENDNQILKQQLQYALIEIDKLIEQRESFNQNQVINSELKEQLHNFKIQLLQNQLSKLKNTLTIFKNSNSHTKTSINFNQEPSTTLKYTYSLDNFMTPKACNFCSEVTPKRINHQDNILTHVKSEDKLSKDESTSNRRNSKSPKKAIIRYLTENQISQQNIDQEQKHHFESQQKCQKFQQTHKKSRFINRCFKKESFNQVCQLKINSNSDEAEQKHRLCSDFSQKSFFCDFLPQQTHQSKLIFITEDDNENRSNSSRRDFKFENSNLIPSLQTKSSEISVKNTEEGMITERNVRGYTKSSNKFMYQSTIVQRAPKNLAQSVIMKGSVIQVKQKQQKKGFFPSLANFIVKNRVKRTCQKANSGLNKILI